MFEPEPWNGTSRTPSTTVQLASGATGHILLDARPPRRAASTERLDALTAAGVLLDTVLAAVPPAGRAWHFDGVIDAGGFRRRAKGEIVVHGHDICTGLELAWRPDDAVASTVLDGLFPSGTAGVDRWPAVLRSQGRPAPPT